MTDQPQWEVAEMEYDFGVYEPGTKVIVNLYWVGYVRNVAKTHYGIVYKIEVIPDGKEIEAHGDNVSEYIEGKDYGEVYQGEYQSDGIVAMITRAPTRNPNSLVGKESVAKAWHGDDWGARWYPWWDEMLDQMIAIRRKRIPNWNTDEEVR